jgi:hypothetical protein
VYIISFIAQASMHTEPQQRLESQEEGGAPRAFLKITPCKYNYKSCLFALFFLVLGFGFWVLGLGF